MTPAISHIPVLVVWGLIWLILPWVPSTDARARHAGFYLFCALQAQYFWWRFSSTLPAPALEVRFVYACAVLVMECVSTYPMYFVLKGLVRHHERTLEADQHEGWYRALADLPMVDILIPTYNESWPIVEKTVVGALNQDHPRCRVWLCDDGRRPWLEARARALGIGYLTRRDNAHAKAGNLNAALAHIMALATPPDFVAVLDADFIPRPRFVSRTLALMYDRDVGIVQTPQYHYNPDLFQVAYRSWRNMPDTQYFAFNAVLPARDASNAAYCCGTSCLLRSQALRAIGKFATESITEDFLTTVKMRMHGYRTVYLRELLTTGRAPEGLHEFLTQRGRWCLGGVQIGWWLFGLKDGRSLRLRLASMEWFLRWGYSSLIRMLFMLIPIVFWFTGMIPYEGESWQIVWYSFPLHVLHRTFMTWISAGAQLPIVGQAASLLAGVAVVPAMFKGLFQRGNHRFVVTDKGKSHAGVIVHWGTLRWLVGYAAILLGAMIYRLTSPEHLPVTGGFGYISVLWSVINLLVVLAAAVVCVELPRPREEERYRSGDRIELAVGGVVIPAVLRDISVSGIRAACRGAALVAGQDLVVRIAGLPAIRAEVRRRASGDEYGLAFRATDEERRALIRAIFCTDRYVVPTSKGRGAQVLLALLRRLVT